MLPNAWSKPLVSDTTLSMVKSAPLDWSCAENINIEIRLIFHVQVYVTLPWVKFGTLLKHWKACAWVSWIEQRWAPHVKSSLIVLGQCSLEGKLKIIERMMKLWRWCWWMMPLSFVFVMMFFLLLNLGVGLKFRCMVLVLEILMLCWVLR